MLSKQKQKDIRSLQMKKYRRETGLFLAEGEKIVEELLRSEFAIEMIVATPGWLSLHPQAAKACRELLETNADELKKISALSTPNQVVAVGKTPLSVTEMKAFEKQLVLALDNLQDPGNLGTIIRIADWFGIGRLVCSEETVEAFSPKVVQASMGSIFRIGIDYVPLNRWIRQYSDQFGYPVYGTFTGGENIYTQDLGFYGLIIMGNESKGISENVRDLVNHKLAIPQFQGSGAESLNVSMATAIVCSEFRRRNLQGFIQNGN